MKIVIAGGTGFLGRPLAARLAADGHRITLLSRRTGGRSRYETVVWDGGSTAGPWRDALDGAGAVINLAGEPIDRHWTAAHKRRVLDSRVDATRAIADACLTLPSPPTVFISGSAVGYYGPHGDEPLTESAAAGDDFLATVCVAWESEAMRADNSRTRVVPVRTGLVLARDGGALKRMLPPFTFGVGGRVGSGAQYWPWIHRDDWIELVRFAIENGEVRGPLNATGPVPVQNRAFARALGRAMHRPALVPAPAFALRLLLGEMAEMIVTGQRALPEKADRAGFIFKHRTLESALADLF